MTTEKDYFIQILSDHLDGRETARRSDVDWNVLAELARIHQVNGIFFQQCGAFLPAPLAEEFEGRHATELFYYYNRITLFETIVGVLSARRIPFYTVKGLDLAQFYPVPALRTMGDCDIVVRPKDKQKAHEIMQELGFRVRLKEDKDWMYFKDRMEFEIHDHLLYDEPGNDRESRDLTDTAWEHATPTGEGTRYALDWNFHCLFLLLHLKKHLIHSGVGFRQFMDIALLARQDCVDWDVVREMLIRLDLLKFGQTCFGLLHRWFQTPLLLDAEPLSESFADEAAEKIFASGIFGFQEERQEEIRRMNAITQKRGPRWWVRVRNVIGGVFPSYRNMRFSRTYAFLDGKPWLLPVAWIYRFYRIVRYPMGEHGKSILRDAWIPDEQLDERERELARWGL